MGWLIHFILPGVVFVLLLVGKLPRALWELTAVALLLGMAGYAWQGQPGMAGVPVMPKQATNGFAETMISDRKQLGERFGNAQQWLIFADALSRQGHYGDAANFLRNGVKKHPDDADLWVGLGNALVAHGGGAITPAAQFAFERASEIAPDHPGPAFFKGLAFAQSGQLDRARELWQALLDRSPDDAPWRADVESRVQLLSRLLGETDGDFTAAK